MREAINILITEGFVQKGHGRSARVVAMSALDVRHIYEVRAVLEGLAARRIVENHTPLADLDQILASLRVSLSDGDLRDIIEWVARFHLVLCQKSGNPCLVEQFQRLVIPLFAFTLIRTTAQNLDAGPWKVSYSFHEKIMAALRSGDPFFAEQMTSRAILQMAQLADEVWAKNVSTKTRRSRAPSRSTGNSPQDSTSEFTESISARI